MPDTSDDLTQELREYNEAWIKGIAPPSFDRDRWSQQLVTAPCMTTLVRRYDGMPRDVLQQTLANHLARDAITNVQQTSLSLGTKAIREFFRVEDPPQLFDLNGAMFRPVVYKLGPDQLVPFKYLDIRVGIRHEEQLLKAEHADISHLMENLNAAMRLIDDDHGLNGTFGERGLPLYERLWAQQRGRH